MTTGLEVPSRVGSLPLLPIPSPPLSAASTAQSLSRSSSFTGDVKRLVYKGQSVNIILPSSSPDILNEDDDVLTRVRDIHEDNTENVQAASKESYPSLPKRSKKVKPRASLPDEKDWDEYMNTVRETEILELGVQRVSPLPRKISPTLPYNPPFIHVSTPQFANSISPMNFVTSPMMPYSPAFPSPGLQQQFHPYTIPQSISPVPPPTDWTWSGLGLVTPPQMQSQPQAPEWSVMAVKGASPTTVRKGANVPMPTHQETPPSESRKRVHSAEEPTSIDESINDASTLDLPEAKKQHASPVAPAPTISKRPPFPFAVPRVPSKTARPEHTRTSSSSLNPFASEFVFRPPQSAPNLDSVAKEFSPVHLQESSRSLFNVFAPEFNPLKRNVFGEGGFAMDKGRLLPKEFEAKPPVIFVKPSPTKKVIPIVIPVEGEDVDDASEIVDDNPEQEDIVRSSEQRSSTENTAVVDTNVPGIETNAEHTPEDEISLGSMTDNEIPNTKQFSSNASSNDSISPSESDRLTNFRRIRKLRPTRSATPTPVRPNFHTKVPKSALFTRIENDSPEQEFNGYPSFWEQRLKSARKGKEAPQSIARSLTHELSDEDSEFSDKENYLKVPTFGDEMALDSDKSFELPRQKLHRMQHIASKQSAAHVEKIVRDRLQPVLKRLEALQLGMQKLSHKDKEERQKKDGGEADDENEESPSKRPSILGMDRIRTAVVEALRQEKELFVAPPVDRSASDRELKELKSIIDSLKSKLLDTEDNLDREERRRADLEHRNETLSRELSNAERDLEVKTEQVRDFETQITDLQKSRDEAKRGWDDERHTRTKLDEVIKGIRNSVGTMTDKNSKLSQELATLQSLSSSQKEDISSMREEISKARGENGKLARDRSRLEHEIEDERARFANLQNDLIETGKAVAEQETRWREELTAEKLRVQSLERSLADEERRVKKMEEECDKLGKIAEERGRLKAMVEASVVRERHLENAKEDLERRIYAAEAQVNVIKEERARFEKERSAQLDKEKHVLNAEISSLRAVVNTLQEEKTRMSLIYERERATFALQSEKIESLGRDIGRVTHAGLEREKILESTARDLKESQSQATLLQKEITALREKMDKKDLQVESLREMVDTARSDIVAKDKQIVQLEFIIASTTSPTKKTRDDESNLKLQRREKEILRLREIMGCLLRDNEELLAQSTAPFAPDQQKKYNAMKNILRAERERRKGLEKDLAKALAKDSTAKDDAGRTPGAKSVLSAFGTPGSVAGGLDTPVSLKDTPLSLRGIVGTTMDTPLKGKGVLVE